MSIQDRVHEILMQVYWDGRPDTADHGDLNLGAVAEELCDLIASKVEVVTKWRDA